MFNSKTMSYVSDFDLLYLKGYSCASQPIARLPKEMSAVTRESSAIRVFYATFS